MSKHALEAFTDTLRIELMIYGIDVVLIGPGPIKTPIWDKGAFLYDDKKIKQSVYNDAMLRFKKLVMKIVEKKAYPAEKIGRLVLHILTSTHPKARYAPIPEKLFAWVLPSLLPRRLRAKLIARYLHLMP
jgi:short-subunit dehydrogenase